MKNLTMPLLGIWLIATGLLPILDKLHVKIPRADLIPPILAVLAIVVGVLILLDNAKLKFRQNIGMTLLAIWLIVTGALVFIKLDFSWLSLVMALLAIAAGVLILLKR